MTQERLLPCSFVVPKVFEYNFFHRLQCAYGFGAQVCQIWKQKRRTWPIDKSDYDWWNNVTQGPITDAPWAAAVEATTGGGPAIAHNATAASTTVEAKAATAADGSAQRVSRRLAAAKPRPKKPKAKKPKAKKPKAKKPKAKKSKIPPVVVPPAPPSYRIQQVRDLVADVSDQLVRWSLHTTLACVRS